MKDRATATLQTESSSDRNKSYLTKQSGTLKERISFVFIGFCICLALAGIGFLLGTIAAFFFASIAWGMFLSFWKVAIFHTKIWLGMICIALFVFGIFLDDAKWYNIILAAIGCVVTFLIAWGAGIRLCTLFGRNT